jgi:hypothetical protein
MGQQWVMSPTGVMTAEVGVNEDCGFEDENMKPLLAGYHGLSFN